MSEITTKSGFVALIGKPNAGKSTLMNSLIGAKLSIVTPKPQTTRKRVLGIFTEENLQIVFLDTPGLLNPKYAMQKAMMRYVDEALDEADLAFFLLSLEKINKEHPIGEESLELLRKIKKPVICVLNKIDMFKNSKDVLPIIAKVAELGIFKEIVPITALKPDNVLNLIKIAETYMPEGEFFYDPELLSIQPERFFVSELIRENVFTMFSDEVPYSTEVSITEFKEREDGKWFISADIVVERDNQKQIVIGKGGEKIKRLGIKSREKIEEHLEQEVYLELFVKVRDKWRNKESMLKNFGY